MVFLSINSSSFKKLVFSLFIWHGFLFTLLFSQELPVHLKTVIDPQGVVSQYKGSKVNAVDLVFSEHLYSFSLDTAHNQIHFATREIRKNKKFYKPEGHVGSLNMNGYSIIWQDEFNFNKATPNVRDKYAIVNKAGKNQMVDLNTGQILWEVKSRIYYFHHKMDIALGYDIKMFNQDFETLRGINLKNGEQLWSRNIDVSYGWRDIAPLDDSTLVIVGSGIHTINYSDGTGWGIEEKSGKDKYNLWSGTKRFWNLGSNLLKDTLDNSFYHASNTIRKIDSKTGDLIWDVSVPTDELSKMFLSQKDDRLILIGSGGANEGLGYSSIGKAFISVYEKEHGSELVRVMLPLDKKEYIYDHYIYGDSLLHLLSTDHYYIFDLRNGERVEKLSTASLDSKELRIIKTHCFLHQSGTFIDLSGPYKANIYDHSKERMVFRGEDGTQLHDTEVVFIKREIHDDLQLMFNETKSILVDSAHNKLGELDLLANFVFYHDGYFYSSLDNTMRIFDLTAHHKEFGQD